MDQVKEKNCTFPNKYFVFIPNNLYAAFKKKKKKERKKIRQIMIVIQWELQAGIMAWIFIAPLVNLHGVFFFWM